MDAGQLINAFSASLFALLGIWAAVVRRHWFLRTAVVGGMLTLALLIPAYEVVIEFGVAMALIALVVRLGRRSPAWRARWSIETALLAMVVAAICAAVVGAAPTYGVQRWIELVGIGITASYFALVCLWMVCGQARLVVRIVGGVAAIVAFVVVMYVGEGVLYASGQALNQPSRSGAFGAAIGRWLQSNYTASWMRNIVPVVGAGVGLTLLVIIAAQASGWFSVEDQGDRRGVKLLARLTLCLLAIAVLAPNTYLLYRLCTPPVRLPEPLPAENGYDDLLAAGRVPGIDYTVLQRAGLNDQQLAKLEAACQPVYDLIDAGLSKDCWVSGAYADRQEFAAAEEAIYNVLLAMEARIEARRRQDRWSELVALSLQELQLAHAAMRGHRADAYVGNLTEYVSLEHLQAALGALSSEECRRLVDQLVELERRREPFEVKAERQQIFQRRQSWQSHVGELIRQWNGDDDSLERSRRMNDKGRVADLRNLIAMAALQAYWLDHRSLPNDLSELVPRDLPAVPADPFGNGTLRYTVDRRLYRLWSVGHDGEDDGGAPSGPSLPFAEADIVAFGPRLPPVRHAVKERLTSVATQARSWLKAAVAAASEVAPPTAD